MAKKKKKNANRFEYFYSEVGEERLGSNLGAGENFSVYH